jgi:nitrite reductase/ring-hydroxylating ferredoxin subunit
MRMLCPRSAFGGVDARGFDVAMPGCAHGIFVVRGDGGFRGYLNRCPHRGLPLNWLPDQFLDADGIHIQCANHGALFRIADGYCLAGPCAGSRLTPVRLITRGTGLWLDEPAADAG